jgi:3-oxoacyl-[acyl-carrier-protein] synthase III
MQGLAIAKTTTFLPEKFATKGRLLKLQNTDKSWTNGWTVVEVSKIRWDEESVSRLARAYKDFAEE